MPQSTEAVNTVAAQGGSIRSMQFTVKAGNTVYAGTAVAIDAAGKAVPAADVSGLQVVGIAINTAAAGEVVDVQARDWWLNLDTTQVGSMSIGNGLRKVACVVDDHTVNLAALTTNAIAVGVAYDFDEANGLVRVAVGEGAR